MVTIVNYTRSCLLWDPHASSSTLVSVFAILLSAAASATPDAGTLVPPPPVFEPRVEDPLLGPASRAGRDVASWDEAIALAHQRSTDERSAAAAVDRAQGRWRQSLSVLLPNVRLSVGGAYDVLNPTVPALTGGGAAATQPGPDGKRPTVPTGTGAVSLSQSVLDLGAWRGLGSAGLARESAEESLADVRRRLTQGLARTLVAVVAAERIAELNRLGLRLALERAALTERTAQLGAATQVDVVRVQQDVEVARGALIAGDEQLRRTREALGMALGYGEEVGVVPSFALDGLVGEVRRQCAPVEWEARPDLEAARKNVESVRASREQAALGYLPAVGLSSTLFGFTTEPGFGRFATWNVSAVLSLPLWEGGFREGLVQERGGAAVQAEQALEASRRQVQVEVARARRGIALAESLVASAATSRAKAAQLDQMTRRAFEAGRGTSLELVQSAAALRQADVGLATREFELVQARLDAFLTEARCDG